MAGRRFVKPSRQKKAAVQAKRTPAHRAIPAGSDTKRVFSGN